MRLTRIPVDLGERKYDVVVGQGLLARLGELIQPIASGRKVGLVTHPRVGRLYGTTVVSGLKQAGVRGRVLGGGSGRGGKGGETPLIISVPEGERHKTLAQVERIYDSLVESRFERSSLLVALGGGVIGDMTGFAAATFLRGIPYVQCPTTVIAQVDAAIGGKTGVDHPKGKNLIGAFHQPALVLIDPAVLMTLPTREFVAGIAEIIKYGVIYDPDFFDFIERQADAILRREPKPLAACIKRSVEIKAAIVAADERESGLRKILNYGHTFGHAIETATGYRRYKHGEAIAIGMTAAAKMANQMGLGSAGVVSRLEPLFKVFGLPTRVSRIKEADLLRLLYSDKKVIGGEIHFVLPETIGSVSIRKVQEAPIVAALKEICLN